MKFKDKYLIFKKIESVCKKVNKIKYINSGGCAKYAYYLSEKLTELNIPHSVVILDSFPGTIKKQLKNYNNISSGVYHVMIYSSGFYIDSNGFVENLKTTEWKFNRELKLKIPLKVFKNWAFSEDDIWNTTYDEKNNAKIKRICKTLELD